MGLAVTNAARFASSAVLDGTNRQQGRATSAAHNLKVVRAMAGRRSKHECVSVGPLELKGLPDPVDTVAVRWEPLGGSATNAVPLPGRLSVRPVVGVIGRETETAAMSDAFERVVSKAARPLKTGPPPLPPVRLWRAQSGVQVLTSATDVRSLGADWPPVSTTVRA